MSTECHVKLNKIIGSPYCSTPWLFNSLCVHGKWIQSCLIIWNHMDCSPPGSSVQGILQARILEWVAMLFSKGIFPTQGSNPHVFMSPAFADELFTTHATWETQLNSVVIIKKKKKVLQFKLTLQQNRSFFLFNTSVYYLFSMASGSQLIGTICFYHVARTFPLE